MALLETFFLALNANLVVLPRHDAAFAFGQTAIVTFLVPFERPICIRLEQFELPGGAILVDSFPFENGIGFVAVQTVVDASESCIIFVASGSPSRFFLFCVAGRFRNNFCLCGP